jgi:hypothetical protein
MTWARLARRKKAVGGGIDRFWLGAGHRFRSTCDEMRCSILVGIELISPSAGLPELTKMVGLQSSVTGSCGRRDGWPQFA